MRSIFAILLILSMLIGSGYWFYTANAACDVPILYRIGSVDPRFGINMDEVRNAVSVAESLWEDATGANLFTYDEEGEVTINFVYDDRQELANEEHELRTELSEKEHVSDQVRAQYLELLNEYDELKELYDKSTVSYEEQLQAHNKEVERWNEAGGAPADVYENLSKRQQELTKQQRELNTIAYELNQLVKKMNAIGAQGNSVITDYNEIVEQYNSRFNEEHEFTQGQYEREVINIFQFDSGEELEIVLAHEFGHALSLGHVEGEESVMFHFMGSQSVETGVTEFDLGEFDRICGEKSIAKRILRSFE